MKKILILIALLGSALFSYAQGPWGVRAAFDINIPGRVGGFADIPGVDSKVLGEVYRMGYGGTIGVVYDHWLSDIFFLQPGLSLFYDTYSYKNLIIGEDVDKQENDPSLYKLGIRGPIVIGYSYSLVDVLPMRVYTGPELNYAFAGDIRFKNRDLVGDDWHLFGKNGEQRRFDIAWKIGLAAEFDIATVGVEAAIGVTDLYPGKLSFRDNRISVSVTRFF